MSKQMYYKIFDKIRYLKKLISNFKKKIKDNKNKILKFIKLNYERSLIIIDMS